ncbi:MAG: L-threonylcarbamoyladenylate synthase [Lysobacterales bacterium]
MIDSIAPHDLDAVAAVVAALRRGEAVGLPTETVYGLAADARNPAAIARVFALKGRPLEHPLIVHLASVDALDAWALEVPDSAFRLAAAFWPGPVTLVLRRHPSVLDAVTGGQPTVALRVPTHPLAQAVLQGFDGGLVAPSANRFGHVSPTTATHVRAEFGDALPLVLDGGASAIGIESSIVDLSGNAPRLLRPGMLAAAEIESVLGVPLARGSADGSPRVSGSLETHYAPRTPTYWIEHKQDASSFVDTLREAARSRALANYAVLRVGTPPAGMAGCALPSKPDGYARALYAALRDLDAGNFDGILVEAPPDTEAWLAIRDRLRRACAP